MFMASVTLSGITALDRTTINAWKDAGFKQAVRAVGRRPSQADNRRAEDRGLPDLPALDVMREGYQTYPVTDAVGGTTPEAHRAGWTASPWPTEFARADGVRAGR
jgi:hypothetical protein